jgi:hypothetical protein
MEPTETDAAPAPSFRATLTRVMIVQIVTLVLLWILQSRYDG